MRNCLFRSTNHLCTAHFVCEVNVAPGHFETSNAANFCGPKCFAQFVPFPSRPQKSMTENEVNQKSVVQRRVQLMILHQPFLIN